jgi:hypothetical protein
MPSGTKRCKHLSWQLQGGSSCLPTVCGQSWQLHHYSKQITSLHTAFAVTCTVGLVQDATPLMNSLQLAMIQL